MSKIIKVSTDLKVTVHDFPQGTIREQNRQLCELIGNGCEMIEHVMPRRLYNELGHTTEVKCENSNRSNTRKNIKRSRRRRQERILSERPPERATRSGFSLKALKTP